MNDNIQPDASNADPELIPTDTPLPQLPKDPRDLKKPLPVKEV
jgi:hypothetical protein